MKKTFRGHYEAPQIGMTEIIVEGGIAASPGQNTTMPMGESDINDFWQ